MSEPISRKSELKKACKNCGAELKYKPGTTSVTCEYCGFEEAIEPDIDRLKELPLREYLQDMGGQAHSQEISILNCKNCGANQHVEENYKSLQCVYCGTPLIMEDVTHEQWILPGAVLPFQLDQKKSQAIFQDWVKKLWFAPTNLKKATLDPKFTKGLYLPYWTFDAQLYAKYSGQRGDYYYVEKTYRDQKGRRQTRQERRTSWTPTSGSVQGFVDDTLIKASQQRTERVPTKIARWDLKKLQPFDNKFLAGFVTEKYTIPLKDGHLASNEEMKQIASRWARRDIGGDEQRISGLSMQLEEETFKHILLPVYVSAYSFNGKDYNFYINGENGTLSGNRPYSVWKIVFAVLAALLLILVIYFFAEGNVVKY